VESLILGDKGPIFVGEVYYKGSEVYNKGILKGALTVDVCRYLLTVQTSGMHHSRPHLCSLQYFYSLGA
jgi:hypothetical protein